LIIANSTHNSRCEESNDKDLRIIDQCPPSLLVCSLGADLGRGYRGASNSVHTDVSVRLGIHQIGRRDECGQDNGTVAILNTTLKPDHAHDQSTACCRSIILGLLLMTNMIRPFRGVWRSRAPRFAPETAGLSTLVHAPTTRGSLCRMEGHIDMAMSADISDGVRWRGDNFLLGSLWSTPCRVWAPSVIRCCGGFVSSVEKSG
jgi:hypothetical protein